LTNLDRIDGRAKHLLCTVLSAAGGLRTPKWGKTRNSDQKLRSESIRFRIAEGRNG